MRAARTLSNPLPLALWLALSNTLAISQQPPSNDGRGEESLTDVFSQENSNSQETRSTQSQTDEGLGAGSNEGQVLDGAKTDGATVGDGSVLAADGGGYGGGYGDGFGDYGGGGYGGGYAGGGYGGDDVVATPPLTFAIVTSDSPQGARRLKQLKASRVQSFDYYLGSYKPKPVNRGGYGMEEMYGGGMMGGDYGGYGDGGYGEDDYGGMPGSGFSAPSRKHIKIHAYLFDQQRVKGRTKIELVTNWPPPKPSAGPGMGAMGMAGPPGLPGMGMGAGGMGSGIGGGRIYKVARLDSLVGENLGSKKSPVVLSQEEFELVADTIRQQIWKKDFVKSIQASANDSNALLPLEQQLKAILNEQYSTQIARQRLEIDQIVRKVEMLKQDLDRRAAAQERVVEVQLGNIVLEAQGLLSD